MLAHLELSLQPSVRLEQLGELGLQSADLRIGLRLARLRLRDAPTLFLDEAHTSHLAPGRRIVCQLVVHLVLVDGCLGVDQERGLGGLCLHIRIVHLFEATHDERLERLDPRVDLVLIHLKLAEDLVNVVLHLHSAPLERLHISQRVRVRLPMLANLLKRLLESELQVPFGFPCPPWRGRCADLNAAILAILGVVLLGCVVRGAQQGLPEVVRLLPALLGRFPPAPLGLRDLELVEGGHGHEVDPRGRPAVEEPAGTEQEGHRHHLHRHHGEPKVPERGVHVLVVEEQRHDEGEARGEDPEDDGGNQAPQEEVEATKVEQLDPTERLDLVDEDERDDLQLGHIQALWPLRVHEQQHSRRDEDRADAGEECYEQVDEDVVGDGDDGGGPRLAGRPEEDDEAHDDDDVVAGDEGEGDERRLRVWVAPPRRAARDHDERVAKGLDLHRKEDEGEDEDEDEEGDRLIAHRIRARRGVACVG